MRNKYKKIKLKDGSTKDEHRLIMEKRLGRKLTFNEVVHHIDGNSLNNEDDNLLLMSRSEHIKLHQKNGDIPKSNSSSISDFGKISLCVINSSVNEDIARRIKYNNESPNLLINELNISKFTISRIRTNKSWNHI